MLNSSPALLIAVCGIDGSGKTTQEDHIANYFEAKNMQYVRTRQPTDWYRQLPDIQEYLKTGRSKLSINTIALLAAADRMRHIDEFIIPNLHQGKHVITSRYVYSSYAYFKNRGADMNLVRAANQLVQEPDLAVLLKVDPKEAVSRISLRQEAGHTFEEKDVSQLSSIQQVLIDIWPKKFPIIDGMRDELTVRNELISNIEELL